MRAARKQKISARTEKGKIMNKEALEKISSVLDRKQPYPSILYIALKSKSMDLRYRLEHDAADQVVSLICEYGYLQGIAAALYLQGEAPLASAEIYGDFLKAWHILIQDFITEAERTCYGID